MALVETGLDRVVSDGFGPVKVTLAGTVQAGDGLMYSSGWKNTANTSGAPAVLVAGESGLSGDVITAYQMAMVVLTHTAANVPTMGQLVAYSDAGLYTSAGSGLQDCGYVVEIGAGNLTSKVAVFPAVAEIDTAGT